MAVVAVVAHFSILFFVVPLCSCAGNFWLSPDLINSKMDKNNSGNKNVNVCFLLGPITKSLSADRLLLPSPSSLLWHCRYDINMNLDTLWCAPEQRTKLRAFELEYIWALKLGVDFFIVTILKGMRHRMTWKQNHVKKNHMNLFTRHLE